MRQEIRHMSFSRLEQNINDVFETAIALYELEDLWEYVCQNNTSGSGAYYHSTRHMREMTAIAFWLLNRDFYREAFEAEDRIWTHDQVKAMLAACMLHDMNHSLGDQDDDYNIHQAILALVEYLEKRPLGLAFLCVQGVMIAEVERNIRITRFPYSEDMQPNTIYQKCIRDADILYSMQKSSDRAVVDALRQEMGVRFEKYRTCTRQEFIADRMPFLKTCKMFTAAGGAVMTTQIITDEHQQHLERYAVEQDKLDSK